MVYKPHTHTHILTNIFTWKYRLNIHTHKIKRIDRSTHKKKLLTLRKWHYFFKISHFSLILDQVSWSEERSTSASSYAIPVEFIEATYFMLKFWFYSREGGIQWENGDETCTEEANSFICKSGPDDNDFLSNTVEILDTHLLFALPIFLVFNIWELRL